MRVWIGNVLLQVIFDMRLCGAVLEEPVVFILEVGMFLLVGYIGNVGTFLFFFAWSQNGVAQHDDLHKNCWWMFIGLALVGIFQLFHQGNQDHTKRVRNIRLLPGLPSLYNPWVSQAAGTRPAHCFSGNGGICTEQ
eukprot:CAMPEP_0172903646 /NCGR_PEP_ID=MMETSP1075-20121228/171015_1 /TAXON_ID=2916 /ORGANISM="Ceratium fusus, Strain PA161109" /LENGTH=135 /DNA_ID=CAMNT_0013760519 /DNA_START=300 /DNA_END=707 /DNA_ORIENTATION=+